jgi:uracil phosphoribosyltransferase
VAVPPTVTVVDHPLVKHKLTLMRRQDTSTSQFRDLLKEISVLLAYEATRDMPLVYEDIETPLCPMKAPVLEGKKVVVVAILRAGMGMLDGFLNVIPSARVGHIGLYRDPKTLVPVEYYFKLPEQVTEREVLLVDPMLATGHSAVAAVEGVKRTNPRRIKMVCLLAAPEGLAYFHEHHPDVDVYTAAIDDRLNEKSYILPGLGDAGDRLFGTK